MTTWSLKMEKRTWYFTPVSGNCSRPYRLFSRSTMAFFTMDWQAGAEWSWLVMEYPFTGKAPSRGI